MRIVPICACLAAFAFAAPTPVRAVSVADRAVAVRASAPMTLDPTLKDERWNAVPRMSDFTDATRRTPGASKTSAALLYDDVNLYVAFWSEQTLPITSLQATNNVGFGTDDFVGIGVDPSGNADRAYYFEMTPRGTRYQSSSENARYLPQWQGAAKVTDAGWTAMFVIPLDALKLPAATVQTWRINFVRFVARDTERLTFSYDGRMNTSPFPDLFDARFWATLPDVRIAQRAFRRQPSVALYALQSGGRGRASFISPSGAAFTENPHDAGLDLSYPLTPTMSFVGAVDPDFSNVDADQVTITPQVFPRNLTEYRPFFAQGANYINNAATQLGINEPPNVTFYSPAIGSFDRGFKVEGTYGKYQSLGVLEARGTDPSTGDPFDDVAFGWKHVLPSRTFAYWTNGAIANHPGVHDATIEFGTEARDLRAGWVGALFHERESGTLVTDPSQALSTYGFIDQQGPTHEYLLAYRDIGPQYNPVDGFTLISDIRGLGSYVNLFGAGPKGTPIKNDFVSFFADRYLDRSGAVHKADAGFNVFAEMKGNFSLNFGTTEGEVRSYNGNYNTGFPNYLNPLDQRFDLTNAGITYGPNSPSPINVGYSFGPFGNFFLQQINSGLTRPLGRRYTLSLEYDGTRERFFAGGSDGQWLRRASLGWSIDQDTTLSVALRDISGTGGFAAPGNNLSASFHRIVPSGDEFYLSFGTPSATQTVDRVLLKYVFRLGTQTK